MEEVSGSSCVGTARNERVSVVIVHALGGMQFEVREARVKTCLNVLFVCREAVTMVHLRTAHSHFSTSTQSVQMSS
jgi:peptide subunit release factor RF-3